MKKTTTPVVVEVSSGVACTEESLVTSDEISMPPARRRTKRDAITSTTAVEDVVEEVGVDEELLGLRLLMARQMKLLLQPLQPLRF